MTFVVEKKIHTAQKPNRKSNPRKQHFRNCSHCITCNLFTHRIDNETIDDIVSGKLPNRLVSAVFEMVRSNDRMKEIIRPLVNINDNVPVFNEKSQNARSKLKANGLLSQIMTSMNDIIRDQVREQTCVTLRPDLQRYVDDIRDFYEQERIDNGHGKDDADVDDVYAIGSNSHSKTPKRNSKPKRQAIDTDVTTSEHFDYDTFTRICNHVTINEKYALIIGLLEQYERLGDSDRLQVIVQKRYLEDHLHLLDELEMFVHRQNAAKRFKKDAREEKRSGRFEKLVRTAETIRKNAMIVDDDDAWVGFDTEHETNFDDWRIKYCIEVPWRKPNSNNLNHYIFFYILHKYENI